MSALREFANFITLNMANLAATYARLLAESGEDYDALPPDSRIASARKLLRAVIVACELENADPLCHLFDGTAGVNPEQAVGRWAIDFEPPQPLVEVECLGQTLSPVVTNLEAGKFLWETLFEVRSTVLQATEKMPSSPATYSGNGGESVAPALDDVQIRQVREALAKERNLLRTLIDNLPDYIYAKDIDSRFIIGNTALAHLVGVAPDELIGKTDVDFYPPELADQFRADEQAIIRSGQSLIEREEPGLDSAGRSRWISTTKVPVRDSRGRLTGIVGISRDITERKQLEVQREQLLADIDSLFHANAELNVAQSYDDILAVLRRYTVLGRDSQNVSLNYFDRHWTEVQTPEWVHVPARWSELPVGAVSTRYPFSAFPSLKTSLHIDTPTIIEDVATDPRLDKNARALYADRFGAASTIFVSLAIGGQWIGFINAVYQQKTSFSEAEIRLLTALAGQVAAAMENKRLFDQAQQEINERTRMEVALDKRATEMETVAQVSAAASTILEVDRLLQEVATLTKERFGLYHTQLYLLSDNGDTLNPAASTYDVEQQPAAAPWNIPVDRQHSLVAQAARSRHGVIVNNVRETPDSFGNLVLPGTRSEMAVPLIAGDNLLGVLDVQSEVVNRFSEEDLQIQSTLAAQVSNAIRNAQLFENLTQAQMEAETRLQETDALQELSRILAGLLQIEEILAVFFDACTKVIGFEYVQFATIDKAQNRVKAIAGVGVSQEHMNRANRDLDGPDIMADIIRTGKTELITGWDDRYDKETFDALDHADWVRIFTPVTLRREHIGLVEAGFNKAKSANVGDPQLRLLRAFIDQTALALDNAQRYDASQRAFRREQDIRQITDKLRGATSLDALVKTAATELGKRFSSEYALVQLGLDTLDE